MLLTAHVRNKTAFNVHQTPAKQNTLTLHKQENKSKQIVYRPYSHAKEPEFSLPSRCSTVDTSNPTIPHTIRVSAIAPTNLLHVFESPLPRDSIL